MDTFDTVTTVTLFGWMMPLLVEVLKHFFPKTNPRYFSIGFSAFIAIAAGIGVVALGEVAYYDLIEKMSIIGTFIYAIGTTLYKMSQGEKKD